MQWKEGGFESARHRFVFHFGHIATATPRASCICTASLSILICRMGTVLGICCGCCGDEMRPCVLQAGGQVSHFLCPLSLSEATAARKQISAVTPGLTARVTVTRDLHPGEGSSPWRSGLQRTGLRKSRPLQRRPSSPGPSAAVGFLAPFPLVLRTAEQPPLPCLSSPPQLIAFRQT